MDDELKLPEGDDIDLNLDDIAETDNSGLPETKEQDVTDFNLDTFLAEDAEESSADVSLQPGESELNLDSLFGDEMPSGSEISKQEGGEVSSFFEGGEESSSATEGEKNVADADVLAPENGVGEEASGNDLSEDSGAASAKEDLVSGDDASEEDGAAGDFGENIYLDEEAAAAERFTDQKSAEYGGSVSEGKSFDDENALFDAGTEVAGGEDLTEASSLDEGLVSEDGSLSIRAGEENSEPENPVSSAETDTVDEPAKGWAFEGLDKDLPTVPEDEGEHSDETEFSENQRDTVERDVAETADGEAVVWSAAGSETSGTYTENQITSETGYDMQEKPGFVRWYSGSSDDATFEIDRNSDIPALVGDENCKVIHVNVGYDTYGWVVEFANGMVMNLRDVREYQLRNGELPAADGTIVYGERRTEFHNIEKIMIYESVRYFTYSPN